MSFPEAKERIFFEVSGKSSGRVRGEESSERRGISSGS
jgi:hypothetical protein